LIRMIGFIRASGAFLTFSSSVSGKSRTSCDFVACQNGLCRCPAAAPPLEFVIPFKSIILSQKYQFC
jgi:hypothetical protein